MGQNNSAVGCNKWGHNVNEKVSAIVFNFSKEKKKVCPFFFQGGKSKQWTCPVQCLQSKQSLHGCHPQ